MVSNERKSVFIPGSVPSSKNSKVATKTGLFHSKSVGKYLRSLGIMSYSVSKRMVTGYKTIPSTYPIEDLTDLFKDSVSPVKVGLHFVRKDKKQFDFHNISQIIFDLMVAHGIIDDDNMDCVLPFPYQINDRWYSVDKENPGVYVSILE